MLEKSWIYWLRAIKVHEIYIKIYFKPVEFLNDESLRRINTNSAHKESNAIEVKSALNNAWSNWIKNKDKP